MLESRQKNLHQEAQQLLVDARAAREEGGGPKDGEEGEGLKGEEGGGPKDEEEGGGPKGEEEGLKEEQCPDSDLPEK